MSFFLKMSDLWYKHWKYFFAPSLMSGQQFTLNIWKKNWLTDFKSKGGVEIVGKMAGESRRNRNRRLQLLKSQVATAKTVKNLSKGEQGAWLGGKIQWPWEAGTAQELSPQVENRPMQRIPNRHRASTKKRRTTPTWRPGQSTTMRMGESQHLEWAETYRRTSNQQKGPRGTVQLQQVEDGGGMASILNY